MPAQFGLKKLLPDAPRQWIKVLDKILPTIMPYMKNAMARAGFQMYGCLGRDD